MIKLLKKKKVTIEIVKKLKESKQKLYREIKVWERKNREAEKI